MFDTWDYLKQGIHIKPNIHKDSLSFEAISDNINSKMINQASSFLMNWFTNVLKKWREDQFHYFMRVGRYQDARGQWKQGFDYIGDLVQNHGREFNWLLNIASNGIEKVSFDLDDMTNRTVTVLRNYGWRQFYPHEIIGLHDTLEKIHILILQRRQQKLARKKIF